MVTPQGGSHIGGPLDAALTELVYAEAPPYASARGYNPRHSLSEKGRSTPRGWPRAESFGSDADSDFGIAERGWTPRPQPRPEVVPALPLLGGSAKAGLGKVQSGQAQGASLGVGSQKFGGVSGAPKGRLEKLMEELMSDVGGTHGKVDAAVGGRKGLVGKKAGSLGGA